MPDLSKQYEERLLKLIASYSRRIQGVYYDAIIEVSIFSQFITDKGISFDLDAYPLVKKKLQEILANMHNGIQSTIIKGIQQSWDLSNQKNDKLTSETVGDREISKKVSDLVYNPNAEALRNFIKRTEQGLNLSKRVWNLIEPYQYELEAGLSNGISKGQSAASLATDLKRYLNEPEKLFRRVRDENGVLQLSKAAKAYNPGQGVYRSSYKNALRLTGTETNMAYRTADYNRWNSQKFVLGMEVKTSNNHPEYDICDSMAGKYPKDFLFRAWHPNCRCYAVPVMVSDEDFNKQEDVLLGLSNEEPELNYISSMPAKAKAWVQSNAERINNWSNTPYWVKDNPDYVRELLK